MSKQFWLPVLLSGLLASCVAEAVPCRTAVWKEAPPNAFVNISMTTTKVHVGEWPWVTFRITNCGSFPFYIPKTVQDAEWHGGFDDIVTEPLNAKGMHRIGVADYGPDYHPDVVKEVKESWILLMPGQFYGGTEEMHTAPATRGRWKVIGRHNPPRITDELREKLRTDLKFPVLLDAVDSAPVYFEVVK